MRVSITLARLSKRHKALTPAMIAAVTSGVRKGSISRRGYRLIMPTPRKTPFCVERFNRFASLGIMVWSAAMLTLMSMGWVSSKSEMFFVTVFGGSSAVFGVNAVNKAGQGNSTASASRPTIKRKTPPTP